MDRNYKPLPRYRLVWARKDDVNNIRFTGPFYSEIERLQKAVETWNDMDPKCVYTYEKVAE